MKKYLTILAVLLMSTTLITAANAANYAIVIDAGSTGSRLHLYQIDATATMPVIKELFTEATKPGLSSFKENPENAGVSLKKLADDALQQLTIRGIDPKTVPVTLYGTAGMRALDTAHQRAIYNNVSYYLETNSVFPINVIDSMTGEMEGLYGWLAVNYLQGNFEKKTATSGIIDMGGASTQIAFNMAAKTKYSYADLTINGVQYHVYSASFSGFGLDALRNTVMHYSAAFPAETDLAASCYPTNDAFDVNDANRLGQYNFTTCQSFTHSYLALNLARGMIPYHDDQKFIAFSGVYFTYNFFGVDQTPDQASLERALVTTCVKPWGELQKEMPLVPQNFLSAYCENGVYLDNLLYDVYHLTGENQLSVVNQINQQPVDWTLGQVLYQSVILH